MAGEKQREFTFEEKKAYYKKKWRKDHIWLFILLGLIWGSSLLLPVLIGKPGLIGLSAIVANVEYAWQNNRMMIYVESKLYDE